jgi:carboxylate-amine ligase
MLASRAQGHSDHSDPLMGVEEEYLLVDPATRRIVPAAAEVIGRAAAGDLVTRELTRFQIEVKTPPCGNLTELYRELRRMRAMVAEAAVAEGVRVVASGSVVLGDPMPLSVTEEPRYVSQAATFRTLANEHGVCASQVHVSVADREHALLAGNHLRPWLPVLIAVMSNSPFWSGRDTGFACWRRIVWSRWPTWGPPPFVPDLGAYDQLVGDLADSGVLVDEGTLYWDIRPSSRFPTIELRVADVPVTAEESVLLAALARGLVVTALEAVARGDTGPRPRHELLRAACWRAARDGLAATWLDPLTAKPVGVDHAVESLVDHVRPALSELGDLDAVTLGLRRLWTAGSGADRQRAAFAHRGCLTGVVDYLAEHMPSGELGPAKQPSGRPC